MDTKSLIICSNSIMAENVKAALAEKGIECVINDQSLNYAPTYGSSIPGFEILVDANDYDKAREIADKVETERNADMPWCPVCGSTNITSSVIHHRHWLPWTKSWDENQYHCNSCGKDFTKN